MGPLKNIRYWRLFGLTFLGYFSILLFLALVQFVLHYHFDLFGKNLEITTFLKLILLASGTLLSLIIPVVIILTTTTFYRRIYKEGTNNILISIKRALVPSFFIASIGFIWVAFILPSVNLEMDPLLFAIRSKGPNDALDIPNKTLFRSNKEMIILSDMQAYQDTVQSQLLSIKSRFIKYLKANPALYLSLDNDTIRKLSITPKDIDEIKVDSSISFHRNVRAANNFIESIKMETHEVCHQLSLLEIEEAKMYSYPVILIISYYFGMFIGILNRQNKYLIIVLISFNFTVFPLLYLLSTWLEHLSRQGNISPFFGQFYYLILFSFFTLLLYIYANKTLKRSTNI